MKVYRTVRLLTNTALYIIGNDGNCANVDCHFCPLHQVKCNVDKMQLLAKQNRKPLLIKYLITAHGERVTKELLTEELI